MIKNDKVYCDYCGKRIFRQRSIDFGPTAAKNKRNHFCDKYCMRKYSSKYGSSNSGIERTKSKQKCDICYVEYYANLNSRYCPECRKLISCFRSAKYKTLEEYVKYLSNKKTSKFYNLSKRILHVWKNHGGPDDYGWKKHW